jgi:hypothetical protein
MYYPRDSSVARAAPLILPLQAVWPNPQYWATWMILRRGVAMIGKRREKEKNSMPIA